MLDLILFDCYGWVFYFAAKSDSLFAEGSLQLPRTVPKGRGAQLRVRHIAVADTRLPWEVVMALCSPGLKGIDRWKYLHFGLNLNKSKMTLENLAYEGSCLLRVVCPYVCLAVSLDERFPCPKFVQFCQVQY